MSQLSDDVPKYHYTKQWVRDIAGNSPVSGLILALYSKELLTSNIQPNYNSPITDLGAVSTFFPRNSFDVNQVNLLV